MAISGLPTPQHRFLTLACYLGVVVARQFTVFNACNFTIWSVILFYYSHINYKLIGLIGQQCVHNSNSQCHLLSYPILDIYCPCFERLTQFPYWVSYGTNKMPEMS
jgi:hypothetical protein